MDSVINLLDQFCFVIAPVFYKLLFLSVSASIIGIAIQVLKHFWDAKISSIFRCILWLIFIAALILPYRPSSRASLLGDVAEIQSTSFRNEYQQTRQYVNELTSAMAGLPDDAPGASRQQEILARAKADRTLVFNKSLAFDYIIPCTWFLGMIGFLLYRAIGAVRLRRTLLKHAIRWESNDLHHLLQVCKTQLGIKRNIKILCRDDLKSPALVGMIHPVIALPPYIAEMDEKSIKHILLHELGHYKGFHIPIVYLLSFLRSVYWFQPLVAILLSQLKQDLEIVNDAHLLRIVGDEHKKDYALSLVKVLAASRDMPFRAGHLGMTDRRKNIERRISMILAGQKNMVSGLLSTVAVSLLCLLFLTVQSSTANDNLVGNWTGVQANGANVMYTFCSDGFFSVVSDQGGYMMKSLNGSYTENKTELHFRFTGNGTMALPEAEIYESAATYVLSADGQKLVLSIEDASQELVKTSSPSMLQMSGTWESLLTDEGIQEIAFDLNGIIHIIAENEYAAAESYRGFYTLYDGQIHITYPTDEGRGTTETMDIVLLSDDEHTLVVSTLEEGKNSVTTLTRRKE